MFSDAIFELTQPYVNARRKIWQNMIVPEVFAKIYPHLAVQTYHYIRHSCPLMKDALEGAKEPLAEYLREHIEEEANHDLWMLDDIEKLGLPKSTVLVDPPLPAVARLVGSQMYATKVFGPSSILGYIFVLEAFPPKVAFLKELATSSGIPIEAMNTFMEHGDLDIEHREELLETINSAWIQSDDKEAILCSAETASQNILEVFEGISKFCDRLSPINEPATN